MDEYDEELDAGTENMAGGLGFGRIWGCKRASTDHDTVQFGFPVNTTPKNKSAAKFLVRKDVVVSGS